MRENGPPVIEIAPEQVTAALRSLFSPADPASVRCDAVLEGHAAGRIFTDRPEQPAWAVLQEGAFDSLYLAGELQPPHLHALIKHPDQTTIHQQGEKGRAVE